MYSSPNPSCTPVGGKSKGCVGSPGRGGRTCDGVLDYCPERRSGHSFAQPFTLHLDLDKHAASNKATQGRAEWNYCIWAGVFAVRGVVTHLLRFHTPHFEVIRSHEDIR